jgi:hypothetical protein
VITRCWIDDKLLLVVIAKWMTNWYSKSAKDNWALIVNYKFFKLLLGIKIVIFPSIIICYQ